MSVFLRRATFAGTCTRCAGPIEVGDMIFWASEDRSARHQTCGEHR